MSDSVESMSACGSVCHADDCTIPDRQGFAFSTITLGASAGCILMYCNCPTGTPFSPQTPPQLQTGMAHLQLIPLHGAAAPLNTYYLALRAISQSHVLHPCNSRCRNVRKGRAHCAATPRQGGRWPACERGGKGHWIARQPPWRARHRVSKVEATGRRQSRLTD